MRSVGIPACRVPNTSPGPRSSEILLGEREAVAALGDRLEARPRLVGQRRLIQQHAVARVGAAADAPAQLVQLRQPEALGVLDDDHRRVRHVDADLDHRRRHQQPQRAGGERVHHALLRVRRRAGRAAGRPATPGTPSATGARPSPSRRGRRSSRSPRPADRSRRPGARRPARRARTSTRRRGATRAAPSWRSAIGRAGDRASP